MYPESALASPRPRAAPRRLAMMREYAVHSAPNGRGAELPTTNRPSSGGGQLGEAPRTLEARAAGRLELKRGRLERVRGVDTGGET
jgi:hypothetical protein